MSQRTAENCRGMSQLSARNCRGRRPAQNGECYASRCGQHERWRRSLSRAREWACAAAGWGGAQSWAAAGPGLGPRGAVYQSECGRAPGGHVAGPAQREEAWQAAWLLRAVTCMDLTTLQGDDTPGNVRRLCAKARQPVRREVLELLGVGDLQITVGAVCVYHNLVATAVEALAGSGIPVAAVSTGFPAGQTPFETKLAEIRASLAAGANEIDIVISRAHVLTGDFAALYDEVRAFRETCGDVHMKTIIATGELGTLRNVRAASLVCMMAGADFIKTSTGKEPTNATLANSLIMVRAARDYFDRTGWMVGFKPAVGFARRSSRWTGWR